jgi:hypothetical protein
MSDVHAALASPHLSWREKQALHQEHEQEQKATERRRQRLQTDDLKAKIGLEALAHAGAGAAQAKAERARAKEQREQRLREIREEKELKEEEARRDEDARLESKAGEWAITGWRAFSQAKLARPHRPLPGRGRPSPRVARQLLPGQPPPPPGVPLRPPTSTCDVGRTGAAEVSAKEEGR